MVLQSVLLPVPNSPGSLLSTLPGNLSLPSTFINTSQRSTSSYTIPPLTRKVEAFVLKGRFVIGSQSATGSPWFEKQKSAFYTSQMVFPVNVGAHALIRSITLRTASGTCVCLEQNYPEMVFRNSKSAPGNRGPLGDIGADVHFDDEGHLRKPPLTVQQHYRDFFIRIRLPFNAEINLLSVGGLTLDIVWNTPQTACTFPNLIFPNTLLTDPLYTDGEVRPFCVPQIFASQALGTDDTALINLSTPYERFIPLGLTGSNAVAPLFSSPTNTCVLQYANAPGNTSTESTIQDILTGLTFYISCSLQLLLSQDLVFDANATSVYEHKSTVSAIFPRVPGNAVSINLPISGYTAGNMQVKFMIAAEQAGCGFVNSFTEHGTLSNNPQWIFNSSLPGITYPTWGLPRAEYSPLISTIERDNMRSDRFLQHLPLSEREAAGPGCYYFGKTFIAATSATLNMTCLPMPTLLPIPFNQVPTARSEAVVLEFAVQITNEVFPIYNSLGIWAGHSPACPSSLTALANATVTNKSYAYTTSMDRTRCLYNGQQYQSPLLALGKFKSPIARAHHDMRTPVTTSAAFASAFLPHPPMHTSADLLIRSNVAGAALTTFTSAVHPVAAGIELDQLTTPAGVAASISNMLVPLLKSIPRRVFSGVVPDDKSLFWKLDMDTFQIRTLSAAGMNIKQATTASSSTINPVTFQSHPASPATDSPLYVRRTPLIDVPSIVDGNYAFQWDGLDMSTIVASTLFLPVHPVDAQGNSLANVDSNTLTVMPPLQPYAPPALTSCNRLTFTMVGEASTISSTHLLTPDGILRSTHEREAIARELELMTLADRAKYNRRYRGHGAFKDTPDYSGYYSKDSPIYQDCRVPDKHSIFQYNGYRGLRMNTVNSIATTAPGSTFTGAANGSLGGVSCAPSAGSPNIAQNFDKNANDFANFAGDRLSLLTNQQMLTLQLDQSHCFRAVLSVPQVPRRQFRIEMDGDQCSVAAVSCGGGAFSSNTTDPHIEMALAAQQTQYPGAVPSARLRPALGYGLAAKGAVLVQLVYNPQNMAAITEAIYKSGFTIPIPKAICFDSYQSLTRVVRATVDTYYSNYADATGFTNPPVLAGDTVSGLFTLTGGLTIYSNTPYPLGGLDADYLTISTVAGKYDSADRFKKQPPFVQPYNALHAAPWEYSMSLFSICANSSLVESPATVCQAPDPLSNTVYLMPMVDGVSLRTDSPYFGTPLSRIEQVSLISAGNLVQAPMNALMDNGQPYFNRAPIIPSGHVYTVGPGGVVSFNAEYLAPTWPARLLGCIPRSAYATSLHRVNPAIHGCAAQQTAWHMQTSFPSTLCRLELLAKNQFLNARLLSMNYQFNNAPLASTDPNSLSRFINTYCSFGFSATAAQTLHERQIIDLVSFATPTEYTQTVRLIGVDTYKLTMTGVYATSKAFAN
jgi:hypothetical protein